MDRIRLSIERVVIDGGYMQAEFFITPWFNARLEIKVDKVGKIIDCETSEVVGEFKLELG